ncbi:UDP-N-acetylmuramoyl-tripeptide--D-alanyl-D-alanine ligase [Kineococcus radiotolerans]|uniref:UDP-N-acetylmuramoyl-tripeptide--D-alanyl-D-alanine ligase n=2 Tax=Kineococcus radiotolerans TaxID=131568 RepID=A6WCX8_KINRD|nr:UDP-N-acetylmuramoyl-tripeptide--D-alanyl-D-alanine ligase [Kineococcus radiotolerans]ABS04667.1 UDP-N-acetylmuramoylalanyl-D-glutamyl-2,6-diaminopimelate--D-alanyl-D-alanyl ligase [Kineococcus radiotolerans SRS30216 = ATCC BAA-149]MBB2901509.1 UDP-N-acetylmuramoyl-tripeptide--D-alanyl-D-alanine ligase [Kineococcus radiotolerans]
MIALTAAEVAELTGGRLAAGTASTPVTGPVVVDSRAAGPGSLFVALPGERVDGADHAAGAVAAGASLVLAEREVELPAGAALVVVEDGVTALGRLARGVLERLRSTGSGPLVVGVTGSQGKTTTKDLLARVLAPAGPVVAPAGSFNNEIGAPLTVLRADRGTVTLVVEMGARGLGHIAALCAIARPDVGVELVVGAAHAGEFGSLETTARAKGELVEALPAEGLAVLNADDDRVAAMATRTRARVLTFGRGAHADVRALDVELDALARPRFTLQHGGGRARVQLQLHGEHQVTNALAAAAVALGTGRPLEEVAASLSAATELSPGRMQVVERPDGVTVVHDAYNANPDSMRAALKALVGMAGAGRRTWAVLGEMLELGPASREEHDLLGRTVVRLDVDQLLVVGAGARPVYTGAVMEGSWGEEAAFATDVDDALEFLRARLRPGDVVLVKSSNGAGLARLATTLIHDTTAATPGTPGTGTETTEASS